MNMTTRPDCGIIGSRAYRATHFMIFCSVTETYMNRGAESAAEIREAIRLRRELYIFDQFVEGPDQLGRARQILIERRDAALDPAQRSLIDGILAELEKPVSE